MCATTNSDLESNTSLAQAISISPCPPWRTEIKLTSIQSWFLLFLNNCITCWFAMLKFQQTMANSLMSNFFELRKQESMWNLRTLPCYLLKGKIYANFPTIGRKLKAIVCHECILNHLKSYFEVCLQHKKYINIMFGKVLKTIHIWVQLYIHTHLYSSITHRCLSQNLSSHHWSPLSLYPLSSTICYFSIPSFLILSINKSYCYPRITSQYLLFPLPYAICSSDNNNNGMK